MPDDDKKKSAEISGWHPLRDEDDKNYEEKTFAFYNAAVRFSVKPRKKNETFLSFFSDGAWRRYKVKGNADYAKKIVENAAKLFENLPVDPYDIDCCLRKAFALREFNARAAFPRRIRRVINNLNHFIHKNKGE